MRVHHRFVILSLLALSVTSVVASAQAQSVYPPYDSLKTMQGYQPSVIDSEAEALRIYRTLRPERFKLTSECHQRAHFWAYHDFFEAKQLRTMKVYLFFTERYKREHDYDFWYHVAPMALVRQADGTIAERVFDPTYVSTPLEPEDEDDVPESYDNKPVSVAKWTTYFMKPGMNCPVVDNFNDYFKHQDTHYCYIMKTPMYNYIPDTLETPAPPRTDWQSGDLYDMAGSLSRKYR